MEFTSEQVVRLYDTDAAGWLFFGAQFRIAHAALEDFLAHLGLPIGTIVTERRTLFPVVHAEADYRVPLRAGDRLVVRVAVRTLGERSFGIGYRLLLPDGREAGSVSAVHAAVDPATGESCALPELVRSAFGPYREAAGCGAGECRPRG